jgi:hypothetical protein
MAPEPEDQVPDITALNISSAATKSNKGKLKSSKPQKIADSWEDEEVDSSEDDGVEGGVNITEGDTTTVNRTETSETTSGQKEGKDSDTSFLQDQSPFYNQQRDTTRGSRLDKRPEKTMATANRLIGSALGVRIPRTEEQRQFQKSQMENEKKKREKERSKKEDEEKQRKSMWEDD